MATLLIIDDLGVMYSDLRKWSQQENSDSKTEDERDASYRYDGDYYIIDLKHKAFVKIVCEPIDYFYFKDYGKTWALTKEELEDD